MRISIVLMMMIRALIVLLVGRALGFKTVHAFVSVMAPQPSRRIEKAPTIPQPLASFSDSPSWRSRQLLLLVSSSSTVLLLSSDDEEHDLLLQQEFGGRNEDQKSYVSSSSAAATTTTTQQLQQQPQKRWILLVDDEPAIRQAVGELLEQAGYQVTTCADAVLALQILMSPAATGGHRPAAVVSDVRMPGMDGLELVRQMRMSNNDEQLVAMPVVLLTAKAGQTADRIAGYQAGADVYLPKPFDPAELVVILDNLLQQYDQVNTYTTSSSSSNNSMLLPQEEAAGSGTNDSATTASSTANNNNNISLQDLQKDVAEIKQLLLQGGGGIGHGYVARQSNSGKGGDDDDGKDAVVFLAPDERQILEWLCQGLPNAEIAQRTYLSKRRVEQLLTSMFRKTGVKNRTELVRWAVATGNVQL